MKVNLEHSVYLKPKLINEQPFIEVTIFSGAHPLGSGRAVDQTTVRLTENETLFKIIKNWLYE